MCWAGKEKRHGERIPDYGAYMRTKLFSKHEPYVIVRNTFPYFPGHMLF